MYVASAICEGDPSFFFCFCFCCCPSWQIAETEHRSRGNWEDHFPLFRTERMYTSMYVCLYVIFVVMYVIYVWMDVIWCLHMMFAIHLVSGLLHQLSLYVFFYRYAYDLSMYVCNLMFWHASSLRFCSSSCVFMYFYMYVWNLIFSDDVWHTSGIRVRSPTCEFISV